MSRRFVIGVMACWVLAAPDLLAKAGTMAELGPLSIAQGERVVFSNVVDEVVLSGGESARVTANFSDTSLLAPGRHVLVYSAISFTGRTETVTTTLDVDGTNALSGVPVFSGLSDRSMPQGTVAQLKRGVEVHAAGGDPLDFSVSVSYPEHLCPGTHSVFYTAVDENGISFVTNVSVMISAVDEKTRRIEWARLGSALYEKYFEPARLDPYMTSGAKVMKNFVYSETATGLVAEVVFRGLEYDQTTLETLPIQLEPLMARMMGLLRELKHHRFFWADQSNVVFGVDVYGVHEGASYERARGIYSCYVPRDVFKRADALERIVEAFENLANLGASYKGMPSGKGLCSHAFYEDPSTGIKLVFIAFMKEGYPSTWRSRYADGTVDLEENFNMGRFLPEYLEESRRFESGDFGRFTNPQMPNDYVGGTNP